MNLHWRLWSRHLLAYVVVMLALLPHKVISRESDLAGEFGTDACRRAGVSLTATADDVYRQGVLSAKTELSASSDALLQCAVELGGPDYVGLVAAQLLALDDPRAERMLMVAAAMGLADSQQRLGKHLMKGAATREDRLAAFAYLRAAVAGCSVIALESMFEAAVSARDSAMLLETAALIQIELEKMPAGDSGFRHYSRQLAELRRLMTSSEIKLSKSRSRQVRGALTSCAAPEADNSRRR
jgi:hypothetical protein